MKQCTTVSNQCYAKSCSGPSKILLFPPSCLFLAFKVSALTLFISSVTLICSYLVSYWHLRFPLLSFSTYYRVWVGFFSHQGYVCFSDIKKGPKSSPVFFKLQQLFKENILLVPVAFYFFMSLDHHDYSNRTVEDFKTMSVTSNVILIRCERLRTKIELWVMACICQKKYLI